MDVPRQEIFLEQAPVKPRLAIMHRYLGRVALIHLVSYP